MPPDLGHERVVDERVIGGREFGPPNRGRLGRAQLAFAVGAVDLRDRLLVEAITRRRRVAGEQSIVAVVEGGDLEAGEFLDPGSDESLGVAGAEEGEVPIEEAGGQRAGCGHALDARTVVLLRAIRDRPDRSG